jgi:hypothetical protein
VRESASIRDTLYEDRQRRSRRQGRLRRLRSTSIGGTVCGMRVAFVSAVCLIAACDIGVGAEVSGTYSCALVHQDADGGAGVPDDCMEVSGGSAQDLANNQHSCALANRTFAFAPCPRLGAIGGCREAIAGAAITSWYYEGGATVEEVRRMCEDAAHAGLPVQFVSP